MLIVMKEAAEQIYLKYKTLLFSIKQSKNTRGESPLSMSLDEGGRCVSVW